MKEQLRYLSEPGWPEPNLDLLEAALVQSGNAVQGVLDGSWRQRIAERLEAMDWHQVLADVRPFLENSHELDLLTRGNLLGLLGPTVTPHRSGSPAVE
jgi:hypothetical protein